MKVHVATILGAHGIKGEVKIKSLTGDPQAFASYGPLASADGRSFDVIRCKPAKEGFICTLRNVVDRNASEALRGTDLFVDRASLPRLKDGAFYLFDLEGKQASAEGKDLGRIIGFQNFGAGELMELEGGMLIPVSFIASVSEVVALNLPDGFLNAETE
jgi:16S rRNA processing protein RimM